MNKLREYRSSILGFFKDNRGIFAALCAIYAVSLLPLFRANFSYRDDVGRVLWAYDGWDDFGRVTSNALSHIIHADTYLRDISPLTQIIAALVMVIASMALLRVICGDRRLTGWDAIATVPLGLFPYFLCCFAFKFDSPYMALSVLVSIIPLLLRKNKPVYYASVFVCTLLMCTTYQASAGILPMLVVYTAFADWKNCEDTRKILRFCVCSALFYIVAMLLFFFLVPRGSNVYIDEKTSFDALSVNNVINNYITYALTFKDDLRIKWFAVIAVICAVFAVKNTIESKRGKLWTLVMCGVTAVLMLLLSLGAYPLLDTPFLMPRGMYGLGVFITIICVGSIPADGGRGIKVMRIVSRISVLALSWMCVVFSCTYGNALSAQQSYDDFRASEIAIHLAELEALNGSTDMNLYVVGNVEYATGVGGIPGDEILYRLMQPPFGTDHYWSCQRLLSFRGLPQMNYIGGAPDDDYTTWEIAHENCYHTIYTEGSTVVVVLKQY